MNYYPEYADGINPADFREIQVNRLIAVGFKPNRAHEMVERYKPAVVGYAFVLLEDLLPVVGYSIDALISYFRISESGFVQWDLDELRAELDLIDVVLPCEGQKFCFKMIRLLVCILNKMRSTVLMPEQHLSYFIMSILAS